jgi:hypothetical protein
MATTNGTSTKFTVGDWVTYPLSPRRGHALVIEVRGPLGPGGEQLYRIRHIQDWGEVWEFEQFESALEASDPPEHQPATREYRDAFEK